MRLASTCNLQGLHCLSAHIVTVCCCVLMYCIVTCYYLFCCYKRHWTVKSHVSNLQNLLLSTGERGLYQMNWEDGCCYGFALVCVQVLFQFAQCSYTFLFVHLHVNEDKSYVCLIAVEFQFVRDIFILTLVTNLGKMFKWLKRHKNIKTSSKV